jgi:copper chaperone CopZ
MSSASCANRIRAKFRQVTGVVTASIIFATKKAAVEYIWGQVTIKDLAKTFESAGCTIFEVD